MASADFIRLMNLVYEEHYKIMHVQVEFNKLTGEKVTIELKKNDDVIIIESKEDDFCSWGVTLKNVYSSKGEPELVPLTDRGKYYDDIDHLIDKNNTKINEAWKRLTSKQVTIDFDINSNINKLLLGNYRKNDEEILKLKEFYWEILAIKRYEAKEYVELKSAFKDDLFLEYHELINQELTGILGKEVNFIQFYHKISEIMTIDFFEMIQQVSEQYKYITEMALRLTEHGPLESKNGAYFVLDSYRRLVELGKENFMTLYYLIKYNLGEYEYEKIDYISLILELKKMKNIGKLVEYIDPFVRNSESHCSTKLMTDKQDKVRKIRIIDNRKKRSKILNEYSLIEIVDMFNKIKNATLPALIYSIGMLIVTMGLLLLRSVEYKFLLLRLGYE